MLQALVFLENHWNKTLQQEMRPFLCRLRPALKTAPQIQSRRAYLSPSSPAANSANIMQGSSRVRTALQEGRQSMGMWQMIPNTNVSRLLAGTGVDWVCVDCEHGNIDGTFYITFHLSIVKPWTLKKYRC